MRGTVSPLSRNQTTKTNYHLDATNFDCDEVTGQLENRFSGQGHRAALQLQLQQQYWQSDDHREALEARFGEERLLYLQENLNNYIPKGSSQDRFREYLAGGYTRTPRSFSSSYNFPQGGPAPPQRAANHTRALSPRRHGTTRFGPGGNRAEQLGATSRPVSNPGLQAAAALRAAASNATPASAQRSVTTPTSIPTAAAITSQASPTTTQIAPATAPATPRDAQAMLDTFNTTTHDPDRTQVYHDRALWYASHPGEECDRYHEKFPDRLQYLQSARNHLIKEATELVSSGVEREISVYVEAHPERDWMVEAAEKAKSLVDDNSEDEIEAYCAIHPRQGAFVRAARADFRQIGNASGSEDVNAADPTPNGHIQQTTTINGHSSSTTATPANSSGSSGEGSVETTISAPLPSRIGTLAATFFDITGEFLGIHQIPISVPVQASMIVNARARRFDPRELINCIEAMAQSMVDKSQGLDGAHLADDGLSDDEEPCVGY